VDAAGLRTLWARLLVAVRRSEIELKTTEGRPARIALLAFSIIAPFLCFVGEGKGMGVLYLISISFRTWVLAPDVKRAK
jgi:hypothetical protein